MGITQLMKSYIENRYGKCKQQKIIGQVYKEDLKMNAKGTVFRYGDNVDTDVE